MNLNEKGNKKLHLLDRYIGIPLIFSLGLFKIIRRKKPEEIKRIAVMKTASIGDTVLMSGVIKDIRKKFPDAEITFFIASSNYELSLMIGGFDNLVRLDIKKAWKAIKIIRSKGEFDVFLDFGAWPRLDALLTFFAISKYKVGFYTPNQYKHYIYDETVLMSNDRHELDNFRALTSLIVPITGEKPSLNLNHKLDLSKFNLIAQKFIVIHPWPSGYKSYLKEWPQDHWKELINRLSNLDYQFVITGAKPDIDKSDDLRNFIDSSKVVSLAGKLSLTETMALLNAARLVISVNTGIMHTTAAIGVRLVALHGPTNVKRWGPISDNHINVTPENKECGYLNLGFEYPEHPPKCMEMISVDKTYEAVITQLK